MKPQIIVSLIRARQSRLAKELRKLQTTHLERIYVQETGPNGRDNPEPSTRWTIVQFNINQFPTDTDMAMHLDAQGYTRAVRKSATFGGAGGWFIPYRETKGKIYQAFVG